MNRMSIQVPGPSVASETKREALFFTECVTPVGTLTLASTRTHLTHLCFAETRHLLPASELVRQPELPVFMQTQAWLTHYFAGEAPDVSPLPLLLHGSAFQLKVWQELQNIPYGKTMSYKQLAQKVSCKSAQAVGGAVGRNPLPILLPCHRVIAHDGSGCGYAGGLAVKKFLLDLEKAHLYAQGHEQGVAGSGIRRIDNIL